MTQSKCEYNSSDRFYSDRGSKRFSGSISIEFSRKTNRISYQCLNQKITKKCSFSSRINIPGILSGEFKWRIKAFQLVSMCFRAFHGVSGGSEGFQKAL